MAHVRTGVLEVDSERTDLLRDELERGLLSFEVGALGFGLLAAKVEDAREPEFKSFHAGWSRLEVVVWGNELFRLKTGATIFLYGSARVTREQKKVWEENG